MPIQLNLKIFSSCRFYLIVYISSFRSGLAVRLVVVTGAEGLFVERLMKYTETDISDMKVIQPNEGRQSTYAQKSFDDFSYCTRTGDYDNVRYDNYLNKPGSTSIANLMMTAPIEISNIDTEPYFPFKKTGSSSSRNNKTTGLQLNHNHSFNNHDINPHFKLKHNCVAGEYGKPNLSSPVLSNVRYGKIPVTTNSNSHLSLRQIYSKQIAQSYNELHTKDLYNLNEANDSSTGGLKSSYSMRHNLPSPIRPWVSKYDNVDDRTVSDNFNKNSSNVKNHSDSHIKILSQKMFRLDGFSKEDVAKKINKSTEYSQELGREYLSCFDFKLHGIVEALRNFLSKIILHGETQERERILELFSTRYYQCNPQAFKSLDSCHCITCAIILLNTDLYGQNIGKKMNQNSFVQNLKGLNDGKDFEVSLLKNIYQAVARKPLLIEQSSSLRDKKHSTASNQPEKAYILGMVFKRGYVMRKACVDADGRRVPFGRRGWRMMYATLYDTSLIFHKDQNGFQRGTASNLDDLNSLRIHHSLASKSLDYLKKEFVFELKLANWAVYLFQASNEIECQQWIEAINLAASCFSAPPLPCGVGSQMTFRRPLLPSAPSKLNLLQQIEEHERNVSKFGIELDEHNDMKPTIGESHNFEEQKNYFEFEQQRYRVYVDVLRKNYDKLIEKDRFHANDGSQRSKNSGESDSRSRGINSSLYPIKSSPAIIFETRV